MFFKKVAIMIFHHQAKQAPKIISVRISFVVIVYANRINVQFARTHFLLLCKHKHYILTIKGECDYEISYQLFFYQQKN